MPTEPFILCTTAQRSVSNDVHLNGRAIRRLMTRASRRGARLIHFLRGRTLRLRQIRGQAPKRYRLSSHSGGTRSHRRPRRQARHLGSSSAAPTASKSASPNSSPKLGNRASTACCFPPIQMTPCSAAMHIACATAHNYWLSLSVPADTGWLVHPSEPFESCVFDGRVAGKCRKNSAAHSVNEIRFPDRSSNEEIQSGVMKPWRAQARSGDIYRAVIVSDTRWRNKRIFGARLNFTFGSTAIISIYLVIGSHNPVLAKFVRRTPNLHP